MATSSVVWGSCLYLPWGSTFHRGAPLTPHGHSYTKEPHEVTASPTESEGIPTVSTDPPLLLALSGGHGPGLAPEKGWSGAAGPQLGKVGPISQPHLPTWL